MEGLSIKEKAKRYDEAILKLRGMMPNWENLSYNGKTFLQDLVYIIPELKESKENEDEKRIRKELIEYIKDQQSSFISAPDCRDKYEEEENNKYNSWIAWLEKQCEKPANNVETKFKVGDWFVQNERKNIVKVVNATPLVYKVVDILGYHHTITNTAIENNYHLWTIQDAKDGDVLHCWIDGDEFVLIYKGIKDGYITAYGHLYQNLKSFSEEPNTMFCRTIQGHFTPATKEQRDTLIKAMADAGYTFDFEKKELKKIEQNPIDKYKEWYDFIRLFVKQRTDDYNLIPSRDDIHKWGDDILNHAIKVLEQNTTDWSKEDEQYLLVCKNALAKYQITDKWDACIISQWLENKLKSLRPQNRWKPSDEQMNTLEYYMYTLICNKRKEILFGLYTDLKKLKG